jgi:hypothetical protein|tara:strand:+ start:126 stop:908 length:783 start_codon:yes stop_codon:yes gene_type:complete
MEYLTNSSNMSSLFDFNKERNKEYESYEKYLKFYYQLPSKKDPYIRTMVDGKYILSEIKNPSKKIIIDPAKYINLFELFKNLKLYNEIILEKVSILIEKPSNIDDDDRKSFDNLKNKYGLFSKKIQEIDVINKTHFEEMENLTIKKLDYSLLMAKYYNERNMSFKEITEKIPITSKNEIIQYYSQNKHSIPEQKIIDKIAKKLDIPSNDVEKWFNWIEKCYQYLQSKNELYKIIKEVNEKNTEFIYKCENFIIHKPNIKS